MRREATGLTARSITGALLVLILTAPLSSPATAYGQAGGGSSCCRPLSDRVSYGAITSSEGSGRDMRNRLRAIVLWRASPPWARTRGSAAEGTATLERGYQERLLATTPPMRMNLSFAYGGRVHIVEFDTDGDTLWLRDTMFVIPSRDSAIVLMLDRIDDSTRATPVLAGHAYIAATMPESFWQKSWTSGDTTFMVRPRDVDGTLKRALLTNSKVAAFLDGR